MTQRVMSHEIIFEPKEYEYELCLKEKHLVNREIVGIKFHLEEHDVIKILHGSGVLR